MIVALEDFPKVDMDNVDFIALEIDWLEATISFYKSDTRICSWSMQFRDYFLKKRAQKEKNKIVGKMKKIRDILKQKFPEKFTNPKYMRLDELLYDITADNDMSGNLSLNK